jgi:hypothetical protein
MMTTLGVHGQVGRGPFRGSGSNGANCVDKAFTFLNERGADPDFLGRKRHRSALPVAIVAAPIRRFATRVDRENVVVFRNLNDLRSIWRRC